MFLSDKCNSSNFKSEKPRRVQRTPGNVLGLFYLCYSNMVILLCVDDCLIYVYMLQSCFDLLYLQNLMSQADEIVASSRKVQAVITEILHNSSSSIETGRRMYEVRVLLSRCSSQASHEIYLYWDH